METLKASLPWLFALVLVSGAIITSASALNDCMVDRTRVAQGFAPPDPTPYVNSKLTETATSINSIHWVNGVADYQYSNTDQDFINHINGLYSSNNIVLTHTHGGSSGGSSFMTFLDGYSDLYDSDVNNWLDSGGYFIFAGACKSAQYSDLGNSFLNKGFDGYLGFEGDVSSVTCSCFYSAFFERGRYLDVTVSNAATYALQTTLNEWDGYGGTDSKEILGSQYLCLAPSDW